MPDTNPGPDVWNSSLLKNPHAVEDKRSRVQRMFAAIAPTYDLNNRLHSLGMDQRWRKKAVKLAQLKPTDTVVDVACGTGDLTFAFYTGLIVALLWRDRRLQSPHAGQVIGIDFTYEMLPLAWRKAGLPRFGAHFGALQQARELALVRQSRICWLNGDALSLPLPDACCDVVSIAFGIRNVADPATAIREFRRILRPGGRLVILEFSLPTHPLLRGLYNFYFRKILPHTATLISRDKTGAYKYLPESVNTFIGRQHMVEMMQSAGFTQVQQHPLTFGICVCYRGLVPA